MLTLEKRKELIDRLINDSAETVAQWALNDWDSFRQFIASTQRFGQISDQKLIAVYESTFGVSLEDETE